MTDLGSPMSSASTKGARRQLSVGFVLIPNFTLIAFSAIVDLLRLAADEGDRSRPERCSWSVLAPDLNAVTASCGLQVLPWETFDRPERFDIQRSPASAHDRPRFPTSSASAKARVGSFRSASC